MKRVGILVNHSTISHDMKWYESATANDIMRATGGNTGNVAFQYATDKLIGNQSQLCHWDTTPRDINHRFTHLVICCANILGAHNDLSGLAKKIDQLDIPVSLIGVGAQSESKDKYPIIPEGNKHFFKSVDAHRFGPAPNIATRGTFTDEVLRRLGQNIGSVPAGCPSLHISPLKNLGRHILERQSRSRVERVAVAAGNPHHQKSQPLESVLIDIVNKWQGEYILQHPILQFQYMYGEIDNVDEIRRELMLKVYGNTFDTLSLQDWFRRHACAFVDVPNWMRFLAKFDKVIGPRYHGVALGVQAGVPGCVITIDSRTEELCATTGVKTIALDDALNLSTEELIVRSKWDDADAENLDSARKNNIAMLIEFLVSNGLEPSEHAVALAKMA